MHFPLCPTRGTGRAWVLPQYSAENYVLTDWIPSELLMQHSREIYPAVTTGGWYTKSCTTVLSTRGCSARALAHVVQKNAEGDREENKRALYRKQSHQMKGSKLGFPPPLARESFRQTRYTQWHLCFRHKIHTKLICAASSTKKHTIHPLLPLLLPLQSGKVQIFCFSQQPACGQNTITTTKEPFCNDKLVWAYPKETFQLNNATKGHKSLAFPVDATVKQASNSGHALLTVTWQRANAMSSSSQSGRRRRSAWRPLPNVQRRGRSPTSWGRRDPLPNHIPYCVSQTSFIPPQEDWHITQIRTKAAFLSSSLGFNSTALHTTSKVEWNHMSPSNTPIGSPRP